MKVGLAFGLGLGIGLVAGPVILYGILVWALGKDEPPVEWGGGPYG